MIGRFAFALTAAVAVFLFWTHGGRLVLTNDEGIILDAAHRIVHGQRPYIDFFAYMSPGSYWIQTLVFRLFGESQWSARIPVILDVSIQCGLIFWLSARLGSFRAGLTAALLWLSFVLNPESLTAQHRWDSATLILGAVCCAFASRWIAAGALLAFAALCTPAVAVVFPIVLVWAKLPNARRLITGAAAVTALTIGILAAQGTLQPFLAQLAWLRHNYTGVNAMPYGAIIGGYRVLFSGVIEAALISWIALPAIVPILAGALWICEFVRTRTLPRSIWLLLPVGAAMIFTTFPRPDVAHLAFVAAIPAALIAIWCARLIRPRYAVPALAVLTPIAAAFVWHFATAPAPESNVLAQIEAQVPPGSTLYVHPYMPVLYFLTQTHNPARFSFLAPGMMTRIEEHETLRELENDPPQHVLFLHLSRAEFLRVFPAATNLDHRFPDLETWIETNYQPVSPRLKIAGYELRALTSSPSRSSGQTPPDSPQPSLPAP